ncbi:HTH-type transcriptional regulator BetI [Zhongshania aliphaticivorans]|uniref:HTH-type transcriptional regulator BetI n=1 Tax=Zhongshania aliphaticivorans TaxID=1470434 RepID=A0A5S9MZQ4_9GAMM|nr:TetR/AcrR family transcriptional regulator [Zhongshania aliphaticivorans]CAA0081781.1 HTH-type transcriptional regulator BetI [Zhongshania aliphaticivorans]CAA0084659.1 HTH-type transcriptional regulator BetI [Zhongshania aliphaticivorans]
MAAAGKRRTQAERIEASDKAMHKAAITLIARDGPSKMTLAHLGKEAGVSPGLVNHRFGSKDKLLQLTTQKIAERWEQLITSPIDESPSNFLASLNIIAKTYFNSIKTGSSLILAQSNLRASCITSHPGLKPTVRENDKKMRQFLIDLLHPSQEQGYIKANVDLESFSLLFTAMIRGIGTQYLIEGEIIDMDAALKMINTTCAITLAAE